MDISTDSIWRQEKHEWINRYSRHKDVLSPLSCCVYFSGLMHRVSVFTVYERLTCHGHSDRTGHRQKAVAAAHNNYIITTDYLEIGEMCELVCVVCFLCSLSSKFLSLPEKTQALHKNTHISSPISPSHSHSHYHHTKNDDDCVMHPRVKMCVCLFLCGRETGCVMSDRII